MPKPSRNAAWCKSSFAAMTLSTALNIRGLTWSLMSQGLKAGLSIKPETYSKAEKYLHRIHLLAWLLTIQRPRHGFENESANILVQDQGNPSKDSTVKSHHFYAIYFSTS